MDDVKTTLELDSNSYSVDALLATSYWFANSLIIKIVQSSPRAIISIQSKEPEPITQDVINEILVRLTDEELRFRLRQQFSAIETSIVQAAFAPVQALQNHSNE